jgi:hypothetical protein
MLSQKNRLLASGVFCAVCLLNCWSCSRPTKTESLTEKALLSNNAPAISLPGIDWSHSEKTVLLAVSTDCSFCTASMPFYKKLAEMISTDKKLNLISVTPQSLSEGQAYFDKSDVKIRTFVQGHFDSLSLFNIPQPC